ncbi:MAG TPA: hypothetical protein VFY90_02660 [Tepidiformaceae bacterium]|nr:hypothetical protein [Tepidiformaceae bacterium]
MASLAALVLGAATSLVAWPRLAETHRGPAVDPGESRLRSLEAPGGAPISSKSFDDFTVQFQAVSPIDGRQVVYYRVVADGQGAFAEMLGIPRIINPDGSFVLPEEYGAVGATDGGVGGIPGLPPGYSGAIFDLAKLRPGAVVRFGPFFRSSAESLVFAATGSELADGSVATVGSERFQIRAFAHGDGTTGIELVNLEESPTVMASHPRSRVTVKVDDQAVEVFHGSVNFAKTVGYDVQANRSQIDIKGEIAPTSRVTISIDSIGRVHRGAWDFTLD